MKADLERFGQSLDTATSPRLHKAVADTITLMGETTETIDVLMQKLYAGQLDAQIGGPLLSPGAGGVGYLGNLCSLSSERATGQTDWFRTL